MCSKHMRNPSKQVCSRCQAAPTIWLALILILSSAPQQMVNLVIEQVPIPETTQFHNSKDDVLYLTKNNIND